MSLSKAMLVGNRVLFVLAGALLVPLVLNGYPIIFADSANYVSSYRNVTSFLHPPVPRPIFYSFYVFLTSLDGASLVLVCVAQALVVAILLVDLLRTGGSRSKLSIFAVAILIPFSFLAVISCSVMPDVWSSIEFLAAYLLITGAGERRYFYAALVAASVLFAPANGIILAGVMVVFVIVKYLAYGAREIDRPRLLLAAAAILIGLAVPAIQNRVSFGIASPIAGSGAFLFATLTDQGLTKTALDQYCARNETNIICTERGAYEGQDSHDILWGPPGVAIKIWDPSNQAALNAIDRAAILGNWWGFLRGVMQRTFSTLIKLPDDLDSLYPPAGGWLRTAMAQFYDMSRFDRSWQGSSAQAFGYLKYYKFALLLGAISSAFLFVGRKLYRCERAVMLVVYAALFILANASVTGGLSVPVTRYNVKVLDVAMLSILIVATQRARPQPPPVSAPFYS